MFGISTYCLHHDPLPYALDRITALTKCVEVMDDGPHFLNTSEPLESYKVRYFFHAPCRSVNIASILEPIRRASVEVTTDCFRIAAEVNAPVVIHPGYFTWRDEQERALLQYKKSLTELRERAEEYDITFYIENMGNWDYFLIRFPSELPLLDGCGLALDVGHAHLNSCLTEFLHEKVAHFHLHDNNGKEDSHLAIGKGTINFTPIMEAAKQSNLTPIIEVDTIEGTLLSLETLDTLKKSL